MEKEFACACQVRNCIGCMRIKKCYVAGINHKELKPYKKLLDALDRFHKEKFQTFIVTNGADIYGLVTNSSEFISLRSAIKGDGLIVTYEWRQDKNGERGYCLTNPILGTTKEIEQSDFDKWITDGIAAAKECGATLYSCIKEPHYMEITSLQRYMMLNPGGYIEY